MALQQPLADGGLRIVAKGSRQDGAAEYQRSGRGMVGKENIAGLTGKQTCVR
jgi:hypothetical protein